MTEPVQPVAAAAGDPAKTLTAPFDCVVRQLLEIQTALSVETGDPLLIVEASGETPASENPRCGTVLTATAGGLIVYIPAREGLCFKEGEGLVYIL